ncbi:MAG: DUF962 domain-containing protein [Pseudomonadota bacterium]|uniref:DUF962 domain-containing protein n=1 Tax=Sphingobium sp. CECT 9361 TaxID=2845384 RepID=UPI001E598961|nr:DUF962 domain-containing protein [Sphingobium sp. CECT 9361]
MKHYRTFRDFWPFYLQEHARPMTRGLHYVGTSLSIGLGLFAVAESRFWPLVALPVAGYGFAWISHLIIEHNRPATFHYPLWSLAADFKMWFRFVTGRLSTDLTRAGIRADGTIDPRFRL